MTHLVHFVTGSPLYQSMRTCKRIGRLIKADEFRRITAPPQPGDPLWLAMPSRAISDRLVDLYFNVFEPQLRILHMPTFRRDYEAFVTTGTAARSERAPSTTSTPSALNPPESAPASALSAHAEDVFMVKLVLVLALGSCFYDDADGDAAAAAALRDGLRVAAARATRRMDVGRCAPLDKHSLSLDTLQIYCLVVVARQTTALEVGDDLTWITTGALLHTAFAMGLNRDPSHFKSLSFAQSEMRRRLWATILELVVQSSLDQGMPPLISTDDYDCAPPRNLDDDQLDVDGAMGRGSGGSSILDGSSRAPDGTIRRPPRQPPQQPVMPPPTAVRNGQPDSVFTHTTVQRLLYRSLPVRLQIVKALNGLGPGLTYERALQLSAELVETCRYAAPMLRAAPLMARTATTRLAERTAYARLRIAFYELLTRRFHHSLHSPFARKAGNNVQFFFSRRARIETVLRLLSFFKGPTAAWLPPPLPTMKLLAADDPCRRLWLVGRGLIKCTIIDFMATAAIEMIHQLQEELVVGPDGMGDLGTVRMDAASYADLADAADAAAAVAGAGVNASITADLTLSQRELYDAVRGTVELAHARIVDAGETNVKGYLFFRGALAQIDALLQGHPVRQTIVESARAASENTLTMLTQLAVRKGVVLPDNLGSSHQGDDLDHVAGDDTIVAMAAAAPGSLLGGSLDNGGLADGLSINSSGMPAYLLGLNQLEPVGSYGGSTELDTQMMDNGSTSADVDSGIHLPPTTDASSSASAGVAMPWQDGLISDWLSEPQEDFSFGNWFFPINDPIHIP